ncbi:hypothetical protein [Mucilaginibacter sp.]|uniref:hypothetical protein n=1 Tax=Mucilaginibacter sp. TaxID=1882438 RepID=UPI0025FCC6EE|nr:hypothetical protein [Mucilaginibacter sp.]
MKQDVADYKADKNNKRNIFFFLDSGDRFCDIFHPDADLMNAFTRLNYRLPLCLFFIDFLILI